MHRNLAVVVAVTLCGIAGGCSGGLFGETASAPVDLSLAAPAGTSLGIDWQNGAVEVRVVRAGPAEFAHEQVRGPRFAHGHAEDAMARFRFLAARSGV